jgi:hypothetical protein
MFLKQELIARLIEIAQLQLKINEERLFSLLERRRRPHPSAIGWPIILAGHLTQFV